MIDAHLQQEIDKRISLNMLIQGAAAYTFISSAKFVSEQLEQIYPGLTKYYCQYATLVQLNYNLGDNALLFGTPNRWLGFSRHPQSPLANHQFFAKYAHKLYRESNRELFRIARAQGLYTAWALLTGQAYFRTIRLAYWEQKHRQQLTALAKQAISEIFDFPIARYDAALVRRTKFGNLRVARTAIGRMSVEGAAGFGGVRRNRGTFYVVAKAWNFPLLMHELAKGTMELVCLHGLHQLTEDQYETVCSEADHIEYEAWMLQAGPALWKRVLALVDSEQPVARTMMQIARLPPEDINRFLEQLMNEPRQARLLLSEG